MAIADESIPSKPSVTRPTQERMRQGGIVPVPDERMGRPKPWQAFESTPDWLLAAGLIKEREWQAAARFTAQYYLANGSGMRAGRLEPSVDNSVGEMSQRQANAKLWISRLENELAPMLFGCLQAVLGHGEASSSWARNDGEHPACGRPFIVAAIQQLHRVAPLTD